MMASSSDDAMSSGGSDFSFDSSATDSSFNSSDYTDDMVIIERPLKPPPPPSWKETSVERLQELIQQHLQTGTVGRFLGEIDLDSDYYTPEYFEPPRFVSLPETSDEVQSRPRYLRSKTYYTMLGFACQDPDSQRGEAKIKLILETARRLPVGPPVGLDLRSMLLAHHHRVERGSRAQAFRPNEAGVGNSTPLHLLICNKKASIESFRMIFRAWTGIVHVRSDEQGCTGTMLMHLLHECGDNTELLIPRAEVFIEAAQNTKEGARGLVMASDKAYVGGANLPKSGEEKKEELTVFHVLSNCERPEKLLPIFLKWWPECLKFCAASMHGYTGRSYPLHGVFENAVDYESVVKSVIAFVEFSTVDATATALVCEDPWKSGRYGFHRVRDAIAAPPSVPRCLVPLEISDSDQNERRSHLEIAIRSLLRRTDECGRSLLHYILAHQVNPPLSSEWNYVRELDTIREHTSVVVCTPAQIEAFRERKLEEKHHLIVQIAEWIIRKNRSLAFVLDKDGMNPFQFAIAKGQKSWHSGRMEMLLKLVPEWATSQGGLSLHPFALAAASLKDQEGLSSLDTIFELLRVDPSVLKFAFAE